VADQQVLNQQSFGQTEIITMTNNNHQFKLEASAFVSHIIHSSQGSGNDRTRISRFLQHIMKEIFMMFAIFNEMAYTSFFVYNISNGYLF
jgi:hypothetical protein